jgi:hypothetical protein
LQFKSRWYLYVCCGSGNNVSRFLLSTPWDITTASLNGGTKIVSGGNALYFKTDGLSLFTFASGVIYMNVLPLHGI